MKHIPLANTAQVAVVDDEDFEWLSSFSWHIQDGKRRQGYASTRPKKHGPTYYMHRLIAEKMFNPEGKWQVDHINGDSFDNQRSNIRLSTQAQNLMNAKKRAGTTSQYKGVYWNKLRKTWNAQITIDKKFAHLGVFRNEIDAAKAYDEAAKKHFKEFARLNFPND